MFGGTDELSKLASKTATAPAQTSRVTTGGSPVLA